MKKTLSIAILMGMSLIAPVTSWGAGYFLIDNAESYDGTPNAHLPFLAIPQSTYPAGTIIGSDPTFATPNYKIGFLWLGGTANIGLSLTPDQFRASGATLFGEDRSFIWPTGDVVGGAGIFTGGKAVVPGTSGGQHITVQLLAWYDPTGSTTYDQAVAQNSYTGYSTLMDIRLAEGPDPLIADLRNMQGFPINVPEPSAVTLTSVAAVALLFRRRK